MKNRKFRKLRLNIKKEPGNYERVVALLIENGFARDDAGHLTQQTEIYATSATVKGLINSSANSPRINPS